jgi:hypothetical protein
VGRSKGRSEIDVAIEGFGELRSAIELCIEHEIFKRNCTSLSKKYSLGRFIKVNSEGISKHKDALNDIFDRCCGYINGHSNPQEVYNDPSIENLKADFEEFINIRADFI